MTTTTNRPIADQQVTALSALDRLGAVCGIGFVVLTMVGNGIGGELDRASDPVTFQIGAVLEFTGLAAFVCFVAFLHGHLRRTDTSWFPTAMLVAATVNMALKLATAAPWLVNVSLHPGELDPAVAQALEDIGQVGFTLTFLTFGLMVVTASASSLRSHPGSPWVSWTGIALGLAGMATVALPLDSEIAALPFMLSTLWLVVFCIWILRATRSAPPVRERTMVAT